jgi:hypothetical protein
VAEVYAVGGTAVKVYPGKFDRRTLAAIERDRTRLAAVPVLPTGRVEVRNGRHALPMELCPDSLASRVHRDGPLSSTEVAGLCTALSRGLAAAHRAGVLHGGVSPKNVLFRASGEPVLSDFGVACRQAFRRDPLYGIEWVSPETLRTGEVDTRTDMYGLGAVLHFALTGESPHPSRIGETTGERILRVLGDPVPAVSRPDVPVDLATTIARLLAPDPDKRTAPWTDEPTPSRPPSRSRWRLAMGLTAALAALAAAAAIILWPRTAPQPPTAAAETAETAEPPTIDLAEPANKGDRVELTWTASDARLYFAVTFWREGEKTETKQAGWAHTFVVPVATTGGYCFEIRGTVGPGEVVRSQTRAIRDADCDRE